MASGGKEIPHKFAGTKSNQFDNNDFYYNIEETNFHPCQNGQHGSSVFKKEKKTEMSHHQQSILRLPLVAQD